MSTSADWPSQQHTSHSGSSQSSSISSANVAALAQAWTVRSGARVTGTPIVSGGVVYIGSWDGNMYALREGDGAVLWTYNAGTIRWVDRQFTTKYALQA